MKKIHILDFLIGFVFLLAFLLTFSPTIEEFYYFYKSVRKEVFLSFFYLFIFFGLDYEEREGLSCIDDVEILVTLSPGFQRKNEVHSLKQYIGEVDCQKYDMIV